MNPEHAAWQAQSLLLTYPEDLAGWLPMLCRVAGALPAPVGRPLLRFLDHAATTPESALAAAYVETFDQRKRCCPYLTYYAHGDTRNRGMALLALKQRYAASGLLLRDGELPDHLAVMLEYAASAPDGRDLLVAHRAGLELLRLALRDIGSPWAHVLESVSATLPPLAGDEHTAVARLAAEGPPGERVGLDPYQNPTMPEGAHR